jgi:hypothetical protein
MDLTMAAIFMGSPLFSPLYRKTQAGAIAVSAP